MGTRERLITFLGLSVLICKMERVVPALISNRVTVGVERDTAYEGQFLLQGGGRVGAGMSGCEALGVEFRVKASFLPQNRRGIGDKSSDGKLNCAALGFVS